MGSEQRPLAAVIGDVVGSKGAGTPADLHEELRRALADVNRRVEAEQPFALTVGDEFQAVFGDIGAALHATLLVRLRLWETAPVRFGIGWGELQVFNSERLPYEQDGPAWWGARAAIGFIKDVARRKQTPQGWATYVAVEPPDQEKDQRLRDLNAFLVCRDALLSGFNATQVRILRGLLAGEKQGDIASDLGVSQSAVSQSAHGGGVYAVLQAHRLVLGGAPWLSSVSG